MKIKNKKEQIRMETKILKPSLIKKMLLILQGTVLGIIIASPIYILLYKSHTSAITTPAIIVIIILAIISYTFVHFTEFIKVDFNSDMLTKSVMSQKIEINLKQYDSFEFIDSFRTLIKRKKMKFFGKNIEVKNIDVSIYDSIELENVLKEYFEKRNQG